MLDFIIFSAVVIVSFLLGTFGWAQIVGSLRYRQKGFIVPVVIWLAILFGGWLLVSKLIASQIVALYIGYGASLVVMLCQGKIE